MSTGLDKAYDPSKYEADIYRLWEESGAFAPEGNKALRANNSSVEPFSIIMPPPNANGNLHAGHAMYLVEDILARYARMQRMPQYETVMAGLRGKLVVGRKLTRDEMNER